MSAATIIAFAVKVSLALMVFGVGLQAAWRDATYLFRHRELLVRSLIAMNVVMPLIAIWTTALLDLKAPVTIALVALSLSSVPPFLPGRMLKSGGGRAYTIGLLAAVSLLAIGLVPLSVWFIGRLFGVPFHISTMRVAQIIGIGVLAPLLLGIGIRDIAPLFARRAVKPVTRAAGVILVLAITPVLFKSWPDVRAVLGDGTLLAILAIGVAGLAVGHFLGGPRPDDRTVLAFATTSRHPGVAMAIAAATYPREGLVAAAVLLTLLVDAALTSSYSKRSKESDWHSRSSQSRNPRARRSSPKLGTRMAAPREPGDGGRML